MMHRFVVRKSGQKYGNFQNAGPSTSEKLPENMLFIIGLNKN